MFGGRVRGAPVIIALTSIEPPPTMVRAECFKCRQEIDFFKRLRIDRLDTEPSLLMAMAHERAS